MAKDPRDDMLRTIFMAQGSLMKKFDEVEAANGAITVDYTQRGNLSNRYVQMRIKDLSQRTIEELCEATNLLRNRPWKSKTVTMTPEEAISFKEELADALHFFVELCITAGMDSEELYKLYLGKHKVNHKRIESGV